jgi:hypothetical protein
MHRHDNVAGSLTMKRANHGVLRFNLRISPDSFDSISAFERSAFRGESAFLMDRSRPRNAAAVMLPVSAGGVKP